jgi:uncharacterized Zn finger protein
MDRKPGRTRNDDAAPFMAPPPQAPADNAGRVDHGDSDSDSRNRRSRNRKRAKQGAQQGQGQARFEPNNRPQAQGYAQQGQQRQGLGQNAPQGQAFNQQGPGRSRQNPNQNQGGHNQGKRMRRVRPMGREDAEIRHAAREEDRAHHTGSWWADRWLAVLHRFGWKGRLGNGRLYADEGRVLSFSPEIGKIRARVQGTRTEPYDVTISLKPLTDIDWDLVVDIMSCQALFQAQLLAGEMPLDVEEAFDAAYAPLFPRTKEDINAHCSCPDWANPCKHVAAVYYVMADAFDKDPFMLFHLRGRSRDALITMLRQQRAAEALATPMSIESLDAGSLEPFRFWQAGEELESVKVTIAPPALPGGIPKRLGRPPFWRSPADPITRLGEVYEAIARRAREVALNEPAPALLENGL